MRSISITILALVLTLGCAKQAPPLSAQPQALGDPPDFYAWTEAVPASPGRLLQQAPLEARLQLAESARAVRFLYTSEGFDGRSVVVSAAAFLPPGEAPEGGWPVIAWSHGTVGIADRCAPSWQGRSPRDVTYLNHWLSEGYAIVATDYEGLGTPGPHPYLHCKAAALSNIDAVTAAQSLGWSLSRKWLVTGQSQGGHGALCTAEYATGRTPLEFVGTLATAPGIFFARSYSGDHNMADQPMRYLGVVLLNTRGMETFTPEFSAERALTDEALALMPRVDEACVMELLREGAALNLRTDTTFRTVPFSETPGVAEAVVQMEVSSGPLDRPVLIGQGTEDTMTPFPLAKDYVRSLCEAGTDVSFLVYPGEEHSGPMNVGKADFSGWIAARFAGESATNNCGEIR